MPELSHPTATRATSAPYRAERPVGRDGFAQPLRAELTKFRTVRAWMIALCAAALVFVLVVFLSVLASRATNPAVPVGPGGEAVTDTYMFVHQPLAGDGTLTARVASLSGAHTSPAPTSGTAVGQSSNNQPNSQLLPGTAPWAKAGIILEPDTSQGTAYAAVMVTGRSWTGDPIGGLSPGLGSGSTWQQPSATVFSISGSGDIAPLVGGEGFASHWSGASIVNGTIAALLFVIVLAAVFVTSEYRRGLIRTTLTVSPRRGRVLAAKAVVAGSLAVGAVATGVAEAITRHVFATNGNYLFPQSGPALARVVIGTGLFLGLAAALVVALATMLRRAAATVAVAIVVLMLPGVLATSLPLGADNWLMRVTPTAAFAIQGTLPRYAQVSNAYTIGNRYFPIGPWTGLAVLVAYTAAALGTAALLLRRRDV